MEYKEYFPEKIDGSKSLKPQNGMFKTKCSNCGNPMYTYAKDKLGTLPTVYCSEACKANARYPNRFKK